MKRYRGKALVGVAVVLVLLLAPVGAAQSEDIVLGSHYGFSGVISKIESGMLFIKTDSNLQPRAISPNKADRVGLYNAKVGDPVNMLVDSGNVLIDASATDQSARSCVRRRHSPLFRSILARNSALDSGGNDHL